MQKFAWLAVFLVVSLAAQVRASSDDEKVDESDVVILTESNFEDEVNDKELMLVEFYAPWCGHCKSLTPEYAKAAAELKSHDPPIPLGKVDATVHSKLAGKFSVSGYPTLKVFRLGKETDYKGPRKAAGIFQYMKKQVGPAAKELDSIKAVDEFAKSDPETGFAVVGFFDRAKTSNSQLYSSFALLANRLRDSFVFAKVFDASVAKHFGAEPDAIVAFKKFDDKKTVYTGSPKTKDVEDWIKANSNPLVGEFTEENAEQYMKRDLPIAKLFITVDPEKNPKQGGYYLNRLKKAATDNLNKIVVTYALMSKHEHSVNTYGLKGKEWGLVIEKGYSDKFKYDGKKFSAEAVQQFFADYFEGNVEKHVRSEDEPDDNTGPVKVITGKNFDKLVNDPEKDVMIEFYAPWCGHCKQLAPKYEELGKKLSKVSSVTIGKLDATANDYPNKEFEVSGYPTIYFKPAKKGAKPIKYEGEREVDAMYKFIKEKAKIKFDDKKKKKKAKKVEDDDDDE